MAHIAKFTGSHSTVYGLIMAHISRQPEDRIKHTNEHIDPLRTPENYDLVDRDNPYLYYKDRFEEIAKEYQETTGKHIRKDTIRVCSVVCYLPEDREGRGNEYEREFFRGVLDYAEGKFGRENILCAVVHKDENRPHIHVVAMPVVRDRENDHLKLSYKEAFTRADYKNMHERIQERCRERTHDKELRIYDPTNEEKRKTMTKEAYIAYDETKKEIKRGLEEREQALKAATDRLDGLVDQYRQQVGALNESARALQERENELHDREDELDRTERKLDERAERLLGGSEPIRATPPRMPDTKTVGLFRREQVVSADLVRDVINEAREAVRVANQESRASHHLYGRVEDLEDANEKWAKAYERLEQQNREQQKEIDRLNRDHEQEKALIDRLNKKYPRMMREERAEVQHEREKKHDRNHDPER